MGWQDVCLPMVLRGVWQEIGDVLKTNKQALSRCCALGHRNKADRAGEASLAFSCHGAALASWEGERDTVWVTSKAAFQQRLHSGGASLVAELVKNLPATQETGFNSWVGRIPWRRKWQPTSSVLAWRIPWTKEPGKLQSMEWQSPTGLKQRNHHHHIR